MIVAAARRRKSFPSLRSPQESIPDLHPVDRGNFPLSQLGLFFLQVGEDPEATEFLIDLDDELASRHGIRDMVDTTAFKRDGSNESLSATLLKKILTGGVNRRVDRQG